MYMLARLLHLAFGVYYSGLLVYILLGWFRSPETEKVIRWLSRYYEPVLRPIQQRIKPVVLGGSAIDFSPWILIAALMLLQRVVVSLLIPSF